MFVTECSGVHCDMLTGGGQDMGGLEAVGFGRVGEGEIILTVFVSQVQKMKNKNEKGEKRKNTRSTCHWRQQRLLCLMKIIVLVQVKGREESLNM